LFLLAVIVGVHKFEREVELVETTSVECRSRNGSDESLFVEADGEVLGLLPVRIEAVPGALNLLIPRGAQP
jgi:diacylglycerol kinase family enzyme